MRTVIAIALATGLSVTPAHPSAYAHPITLTPTAAVTSCPREFECATVTVPLDHFGESRSKSETLDIAYAILPARERSQRKGVLLIAVGGPGGSGLEDADPDNFSTAVRDYFDVVYFDPRGVGQSGFLDCPDAYDEYDFYSATTSDDEATNVAEARTFAEACLREMKLDDVERLNFYGTRQVAEDIEAIRAALEEDKIWILGESYGTQVAQWYATSHPERVAGMVLDGPVNLAISNLEFRNATMRAYNTLLDQVLRSCDLIATCKQDTLGGLTAAYDRLLQLLNSGPLTIRFPDDVGKMQTLRITRERFDNEISWLLDREWGRTAIQRAVAAASRGDYVLLGRALSFTEFPPRRSRGEAIAQSDIPGESQAMYYVVQCVDDAFFPGDDAAQSEAYLRAGDKVEDTARLRLSFYYNELTCAYWPNTAVGYVDFDPAPAANVPTLIIAAQGDATTPFAQARAIQAQLPASRLVTVMGGVHVMNGRTNVCVNKALDAFLVGDRLPQKNETLCEATLSSAYIPAPPRDSRGFRNALEAMYSFDQQLYELPEYYFWQSDATLDVGCSYGGTLTFSYDDPEETTTLDQCALSGGFALTGDCIYNYDDARLVCTVELSGEKSGMFEYIRDGRRMLLHGTIDGKPVVLTQEDMRR